jgi:hypothetical protein
MGLAEAEWLMAPTRKVGAMLMNEGQDGNGRGRATRFHGILVDRPEHGPRDDRQEAASLLADLRLDQSLRR